MMQFEEIWFVSGQWLQPGHFESVSTNAPKGATPNGPDLKLHHYLGSSC